MKSIRILNDSPRNGSLNARLAAAQLPDDYLATCSDLGDVPSDNEDLTGDHGPAAVTGPRAAINGADGGPVRAVEGGARSVAGDNWDAFVGSLK